MGTHAKTPPRSPDRSRPMTTSTAIPTQPSSSRPPDTPPLIDRNNFRFPRLTPNLKEMINSWNPAFQESNGPSTDIFASPDPTAMYNGMTLPSPSPLFKDFYQGHSPMIGMAPPYLNGENAENRASRAEKLSIICDEMNGLFENMPQAAEAESRSDNNLDGAASNISSPEHNDVVKQPENSSMMVMQAQAQTTGTIQDIASAKSRRYTSQSSSETRHVFDTSSLSPSSSPQLTEKRVLKKLSSKTRRNEKQASAKAAKKSNSRTGETKRPPTRPHPVVKSQPMPTDQMQANAAAVAVASASALAAANAYSMNPALAGLMPFPGAMGAGMPPGMSPGMPPGMPQMYPGAMLYQGRPMAFMAGARGPELIPIDMLAQASAMQYGAAQAMQMAHQMNSSMGAHAVTPQPTSQYDGVGSSKKKRRRQMLERSGCSEVQARENRARALKRLRQKKTVRSQSGTVRYACRKRIAMVRPRVNGRFATKEEVEQSQQEMPLDK